MYDESDISTMANTYILLIMLQCKMKVLTMMCCLHLPNETTPAARWLCLIPARYRILLIFALN